MADLEELLKQVLREQSELRAEQQRNAEAQQRYAEDQKRYTEELVSGLRNEIRTVLSFGVHPHQFDYTEHQRTSSERDKTFKERLCAAYRDDGDDDGEDATKTNRCMVLNELLPAEHVVAAHLFKYSWRQHAYRVLAIDDIDDVRNGLLLFEPIEQAFHRSHVCFTRRPGDDTYYIKLLRRELADEPLVTEPKRRTGLPHVDELTYGELDGMRLCLPRGCLTRPFARCLCFQARQARRSALQKGWIDRSWDFVDFWSEGMDAREKVEAWLRMGDSDYYGDPPPARPPGL